MVGTNTAKYDDPALNVRDWGGNDPLRIVIDKDLKLSTRLKLFNGKQATLCYNLIESAAKENTTYIKLKQEDLLEKLLLDLHNRKIQSVIVEGGSQLLQSFIAKNLWDESPNFYWRRYF